MATKRLFELGPWLNTKLPFARPVSRLSCFVVLEMQPSHPVYVMSLGLPASLWFPLAQTKNSPVRGLILHSRRWLLCDCRGRRFNRRQIHAACPDQHARRRNSPLPGHCNMRPKRCSTRALRLLDSHTHKPGGHWLLGQVLLSRGSSLRISVLVFCRFLLLSGFTALSICTDSDSGTALTFPSPSSCGSKCGTGECLGGKTVPVFHTFHVVVPLRFWQTPLLSGSRGK